MGNASVGSPHSVVAQAVRRFEPQARVLVVPAPLRAGFYDPPSKASARARLGVAEREWCVLLMSGAWGIGPVAEVAEALADAGVREAPAADTPVRLHRPDSRAHGRQ